jgi:hypothetical protein
VSNKSSNGLLKKPSKKNGVLSVLLANVREFMIVCFNVKKYCCQAKVLTAVYRNGYGGQQKQ